MTESINHKQLKSEARKLLREKYDFKDDQIIEEYPLKLKNSVRVEIDVVGKDQNRLIAVECGNTSKLKIVSLKEQLGKDSVIQMPYNESILEPHFYEKPKNRKEKVQLLKSVYNKYVYEPLKNDPDFGLVEYNSKNDPSFYVGKKYSVWMAISTKNSNAIIGKDLQNEVNFSISYLDDETYEIVINTETNPSVQQFLDLSQSTKDKIVNELRKLPSGFETQDGIKFRTEKRPIAPLPRNWEIVKPINCNQITKENLNEIESRLEWYLKEGKKFKEYPVFALARASGRKEDLSKIMMSLKAIYLLSFRFRSQKDEDLNKSQLEKLKERKRLYEQGLVEEGGDVQYEYDELIKSIKELEQKEKKFK